MSTSINLINQAEGLCRACNSGNIAFLCDVHNEHSETSPIQHFKCNECDSVFVGNPINSRELRTAYATLDSKTYHEEIVGENRRKMVALITQLEMMAPKCDAILDIGAGDGSFVKLPHYARFENISAHEIKGFDLSGIQTIAKAVFQDFDYIDIPSNKFAAVTFLDVVEHVIGPKHLIQTCARILKKDGVIYLHTPVVTRLGRLMHSFHKIMVLKKAGASWQRGRTSIFHLENYTSKSLTLLLESCGFVDIQITVRNETSWPIEKYVRTYLLQKHGLPERIAPLLVYFFYPFLATNFFNANKAIVSARKG